jgi:hypothetical protein
MAAPEVATTAVGTSAATTDDTTTTAHLRSAAATTDDTTTTAHVRSAAAVRATSTTVGPAAATAVGTAASAAVGATAATTVGVATTAGSATTTRICLRRSRGEHQHRREQRGSEGRRTHASSAREAIHELLLSFAPRWGARLVHRCLKHAPLVEPHQDAVEHLCR